MEPILELPAGGTAVGTGINTHPRFGSRVAEALANETGIPFVEAIDHFEANAQRDGLVECHEAQSIAQRQCVLGTEHSVLSTDSAQQQDSPTEAQRRG